MLESLLSLSIAALGSACSIVAHRRRGRRANCPAVSQSTLATDTHALRRAVEQQNEILEEATRHLPWIGRKVEHAQRQIEDTLRAIERLADTRRFTDLRELTEQAPALTPTFAPESTARVFLSTGSTFDAADENFMTLRLRGPTGAQVFTFASGTSMWSIVNALNTFKFVTGVSATIDVIDPALVALSSRGRAQQNFVVAQRVSGGPEDALLDMNRANHADRQVATGSPRPQDPN